MSPKSDPRTRRTRQRIEEAFLTLYRHKRFNDITVSDITTEADINRATFYKHYRDKFDLYDSYIQQCFNEHLLKHLHPDAPLNKQNFRSLAYATILFVKDWRDRRAFVTEQTDPIIEACVQKTVLDKLMFWIEPNYMKGPCDAGAEVAATAISWAIFGLGVRLAQQKTTIDVGDVTDEIVAMLTGGLWNSLVSIHARTHAT